MPNRISILLLVFACLFLAFISWRWVYLTKPDIEILEISPSSLAPEIHPLDVLLKEEIDSLIADRALQQQFRRKAESYSFKGLLVDSCEVSQGAFRSFAQWEALQDNLQIAHPEQPQDWDYKSQTENHKILGQISVPVGGVSFYDARAYCSAAGGRLPTSQEFEAIASGAEQRLYPWGNEFSPQAWQYRDPSLNIPEVCGIYDETATPEGIQDLGSSMLEWTELEGQPVLMGGNAYSRPYKLQALNSIRRLAPADYRSQYSGFRCVYEAKVSPGFYAAKTPWNLKLEKIPVIPQKLKIGMPEAAKIPKLLSSLPEQHLSSIKQFPLEQKARRAVNISLYEISREAYGMFLADPFVKMGFFNHPNQPETNSHTPQDWHLQQQNPQAPVTNVSWWSAWSFANWYGGRLPTAAEWTELAGASLEVFPYGNEYVQNLSVDRHSFDTEPKQAQALEASKDQSQDGIHGFAGNVAEWTSSVVPRGRSYNFVIKGGSFIMPLEGGHVSQAGEAPPQYFSGDLGFRIVVNDEL